MVMLALCIVLPWVTGSLLVSMVLGRPTRAASWSLLAGCGYFVGMAVAALLTWVMLTLGGGFLLIALGLLTMCGLAYYQSSGSGSTAYSPAITHPASSWQAILWWGLLLLISWRFFGLAQEVFVRPVLPWDAWSTWELKAKVWHGLGQIAEFKHPRLWLEDPGTSYPLEAWLYPPLGPLIQLWMVLGFGEWNEPVAAAPWWFAGVSILLAMYGFLRQIGASPLLAMVSVWVLGSLPFFGVHIALAGYVDLWLASYVGLAVMCLFVGITHRQNRYVLLGFCLLAVLPAVKIEGWAWTGILALCTLFTTLKPLNQKVFVACVTGLFAAWWLVGGITFTTEQLGEVVITPASVQVPMVLNIKLGFTNTLEAFVNSFAYSPNWHLYWYVALPVALWLVFQNFKERAGMMALALLTATVIFYIILFFFTDFSRWAEDRTSSNRVLFHFIPALTYMLAALAAKTLNAGKTDLPASVDDPAP